MLWAILLIPVGLLLWISLSRNCISWAIPKWWKHGGYLVIRQSHVKPSPWPWINPIVRRIPHFMWIPPDHEKPDVLHYTVDPPHRRRLWNRGFINAVRSMIHFDGDVKRGDD